MVAGVAAVTTCAVLLMFVVPAHADHNANPACTTIKEDVDHLDEPPAEEVELLKYLHLIEVKLLPI